MMADPSSSGDGSGAMYGMAASIPDRSIVDKVVGIYLDCLYYAPKKNFVKQAQSGLFSHCLSQIYLFTRACLEGTCLGRQQLRHCFFKVFA